MSWTMRDLDALHKLPIMRGDRIKREIMYERFFDLVDYEIMPMIEEKHEELRRNGCRVTADGWILRAVPRS